LKLSTNEVLILNVLQKHKKTMERLEISKLTGISDKNISAKLNALQVKGLIISQKIRVGRATKRMIQLTSQGKQEKLMKIVIEKKPIKPKIEVKPESIIIKQQKVFKNKIHQILVSDLTSDKQTQIFNRELDIFISKTKIPFTEKAIRIFKQRMKGNIGLSVDLGTKIVMFRKHFKEFTGSLEKPIKEVKPKPKPKPKLVIPETRLVEPKPLPSNLELKKELRLLINLALTHRKEQYAKYGYKSVSEIRSQIDTLIDQL